MDVGPREQPAGDDHAGRRAPARALLPIVALAATLHLVGMVRTPLPAQDGLKFIRVARDFHDKPWREAVRGSDQHPLYPALVAAAEPAVAAAIGEGPDAWRLAAQGVSTLAALAMLFPLHGLARSLFDGRTADVAAFFAAVVPLTCELGHETLADSTALLGFAWALRLGEVALRAGGILPALGCGLASGLGYWARPEVAVVPAAVVAAAAARRAYATGIRLPSPRSSGRYAALLAGFLAMAGVYAAVKGEVSEKLALRIGAGLRSNHAAPKAPTPALPRGLDDGRWDFAPKEESADMATGLGGRPAAAAARLARHWVEESGYVLAVLAAIGACRARAGAGKWLVGAYVALFSALLVRHAAALGYMSGRHVLTLLVATLPWAAAGYVSASGGVARRLGWDAAHTPSRRRWIAAGALAAAAAIQASRPSHANRWGHRAAGGWLAGHAEAGAAVLDTRGWAAFSSGLAAYDYWHVRQALADPALAYIVVGVDELTAPSRRAATLRAMLAYSADPAAAFPARAGGRGEAVRVYRYRRPESWEEIRP